MSLPKFHTVKEATAAGVGGRTKVYELAAQGKLKMVRNGRSTLITNLREYLESLEPITIVMASSRLTRPKTRRVPLDDLDETISQ